MCHHVTPVASTEQNICDIPPAPSLQSAYDRYGVYLPVALAIDDHVACIDLYICQFEQCRTRLQLLLALYPDLVNDPITSTTLVHVEDVLTTLYAHRQRMLGR